MFLQVELFMSRVEYLNLLLVKHAQPLQVDHLGQTLSEGQAVRPDLLVEPVVSHQMDVGYSVCRGHRNIFASRLQLNHLHQKAHEAFTRFFSFSLVFQLRGDR